MSVLSDSHLWEYFESEKFSDLTLIGSDGRVRSHLAIINHFYPEIGKITEHLFVRCEDIFISIPNFKAEEIKTAMNRLFKENDCQGLLDIFNLKKEREMKSNQEGHVNRLTAEEYTREVLKTLPVGIKLETIDTIGEEFIDEKDLTEPQIKIESVSDELECEDTRTDYDIEHGNGIKTGQLMEYEQLKKKKRKRNTQNIEPPLKEPDWESPFEPSKPKKVEKTWKCDDCEATYTNPTYLRAHRDAIHKGILYSCSQCNYTTPYKYNLNKHTKYKHTELDVLLKHICTICGKKYAKKNSLTDHELTHNERTINCEQCGTSFYNMLYLKRHMRTVHGEENYSCDVCGKKFTTKPRLKDHYNSIHLDHAERKHICNLCGQGFHKIIAYKNHMNKHLGLKPYKCPADECDKSFADDTSWAHHKKACSLWKHQQAHS